MKKVYGFFVFCFIMMLVLVGCSNGFDDTSEYDSTIPDGFGALRVSFSQGTARTAMPDVIEASFHHIEYIFTKTGEAPTIITPLDGLFYLQPGSYKLAVKAYMGANEDTLAAQGSSNTFTVVSGSSNSINVTMQPIVSEGVGKFEFSMRYPSGVTVETYSLSRIAGADIYNLMNNSSTTGSGTVTRSGTISNIPSGYYLLEVRLVNSDGAYTGKIDVVHIYQNMVTKINLEDYTFVVNDFISIGNSFLVTNTNEWNSALLSIRNGGSNKNYIINVSGNIAVPGSKDVSTSFGSVNNITVTLCGDGKLYLNSQGSIIWLGYSQTLIIDSNNLTLEGLKKGQNGSSQDNNNSSVLHIGILGTLELKNGTITGNKGGEGGVVNLGTFTMSGGVISGNWTDYDGGGVYSVRSFIMKGGEISGNKANHYGGGVCISMGSAFIMEGGKIIGNLAAGGPGVLIPEVAGGGCGGGGVDVMFDSSFTMKGGEISGNGSTGGGGVKIYSSNFIMTGGTISRNVNIRGLGGGVLVCENGSFTMSGGEIGANYTEYADNGGGSGGGVRIEDSSTFSKSGGGIIYGYNAVSNRNVASSGNGHAVHWNRPGDPLNRNDTLGVNDYISTSNPSASVWYEVTVTGVKITPEHPSVNRGNSQQFTATVSGANNPPQTVTWKVVGGKTGTSINSNGLLSVANDESSSVLLVYAVSPFNEVVSTYNEVGGYTFVTVTGLNPVTKINLEEPQTTLSTVWLIWDIITGATGYNVYRSENNSSFTLVAETAYPFFIDTKREPNTTYYYYIKAHINGAEVESSRSNTVSPKTSSSPYGAFGVSSDSIVIEWPQYHDIFKTVEDYALSFCNNLLNIVPKLLFALSGTDLDSPQGNLVGSIRGRYIVYRKDDVTNKWKEVHIEEWPDSIPFATSFITVPTLSSKAKHYYVDTGREANKTYQYIVCYEMYYSADGGADAWMDNKSTDYDRLLSVSASTWRQR